MFHPRLNGRRFGIKNAAKNIMGWRRDEAYALHGLRNERDLNTKILIGNEQKIPNDDALKGMLLKPYILEMARSMMKKTVRIMFEINERKVTLLILRRGSPRIIQRHVA